MIRVLFVDDDVRLRECWARILASQSDIELVGMLDRADELAETVERSRPNLVILDLTMPGLDPLEACRRVGETSPSTRIIIYSGMDDPELMDAAYDAGAWGFVDKLSAPDAILDVMRMVAEGAIGFQPRQAFGRT